MRVGIVGGGIGGLLSGIEVAGRHEVDVYEEHKSVGHPRHCTGLISDDVLGHLGTSTKNQVLNTFRSYVLIHSLRPNRRIELKFRNPIHLIDRPNLEKFLSEEVQLRGSTLNLGSKVTSLNTSETSLIIDGKLIRKYDMIIIAEGAKATLTKSIGMCSESTYLAGIQAFVKCRNELKQPYVIFGNDVSEDFFGWVVPVSDERLMVGLADRYVSYAKLNHLVKVYVSRELGVSDVTIEEVFGGLIPTSPPCRQTFKNVIGIGDAVSVVKPLSGGGIYGITRQVRILGDSLRFDSPQEILVEYRRRLSGLIAILRTQHLLKKYLVRRFGNLSNFIAKLMDWGVEEVRMLDYDKYVLDLRNINNVVRAVLALLT